MRVSETTTLAGREERQGRPYPLWIERAVFLLSVAGFVLFADDVNRWVDHPFAGPLIGYFFYPLSLLALAEWAGRFVQRRHGSKL